MVVLGIGSEKKADIRRKNQTIRWLKKSLTKGIPEIIRTTLKTGGEK